MGNYSFQELYHSHPNYRNVFHTILEFCTLTRNGDDLVNLIHTLPGMKNSLHPPVVILNWLEQAGALSKNVPEKGQEIWQATPEAIDFIEKNSPAAALQKLMESETDYQALFTDIMAYCGHPRKISELEEKFRNHPELINTGLSISYFLAELEKTGGLIWSEGWICRENGNRYLNQ